MNTKKTPTANELEYDYHTLHLNQQQIAEKYGYKTRQPIGRLLRKYKIPLKTKAQQIQSRMTVLRNDIMPNEDELMFLLESHSQSELARKYNVTRNEIKAWMQHYGIESSYFTGLTNHDILELLNLNYSPLQISEFKQVSVRLILDRIRRHNITIPTVEFTKDELAKRCFILIALCGSKNQGIEKKIKYGDPAAYKAIIKYTKDHKLTTNKFTEKLYRCCNGYEANKIVACKHCDSELIFYTLTKGYGNSHKSVCENCKHIYLSNSSMPASKLFSEICDRLENTDHIFYDGHQHEYQIKCYHERHQLKYPGINKTRYYLDFYDAKQKKNIEFDGTYWHSTTQEKDDLRDKFLLEEKGIQVHRVKEQEYSINPEKVIEECLKFLKTSNNTK